MKNRKKAFADYLDKKVTNKELDFMWYELGNLKDATIIEILVWAFEHAMGVAGADISEEQSLVLKNTFIANYLSIESKRNEDIRTDFLDQEIRGRR